MVTDFVAYAYSEMFSDFNGRIIMSCETALLSGISWNRSPGGYSLNHLMLSVVKKGYGNLGEWVGVFRVRVPGMLHLHERKFQVLAGQFLIRKEEIKPVIWPHTR